MTRNYDRISNNFLYHHEPSFNAIFHKLLASPFYVESEFKKEEKKEWRPTFGIMMAQEISKINGTCPGAGPGGSENVSDTRAQHTQTSKSRDKEKIRKKLTV